MTPLPPIVLCFVLDIPPGTAKGFDPGRTGQTTLFVLRLREEVRVFRNLCPHAQGRLNLRRDHFLSPDGGSLMCHVHGGQFDFNGQGLEGVCLGRSLKQLRSHISDTGYIILDEMPE